jgi:hypothetical protein
MRRALCFFLAALALSAANFRLYLKDGTYHIVREYKTLEDRIRYYSIERSDWEEIPAELIDLKRTEGERAERAGAARADAEALAAEDRAERELRREIARVPSDPGVYLLEETRLTPLPLAETQLASSKKRSIFKAMSPIPVVAGKSTLEVDGVSSPNKVASATPEFYIRLSAEQRFGIVKMTPAKKSRIVQTWIIIPVTKELVEEQIPVEIFRRQAGEDLYKIWPRQPLERGEYAVVEYTEGKGNTRVWDFSWPGPAPK